LDHSRCSHRVREHRLLECPRCADPPRTTSVRGRRLIAPKLPVLDSTVNALRNPKTRHTSDIRHFVYGYVPAPDQCGSNVRKFLPRRRPHVALSGRPSPAAECPLGEPDIPLTPQNVCF